MKLFTPVLAFASSASASERAFANVPSFITETEDWWTPAAAKKQFNDLAVGTAGYFDNYYPDTAAANRAAGKMEALLEDVQDDMLRIANSEKCSADGSNNDSNDDSNDDYRKRRDVDERWTLPVGDPRAALFQMFWAHARWARNEIYPTCPKKAMRILKRLDRLQLIAAWQYCDKSDDRLPICDWAYFNKDGGIQPNPRSTNWLWSQYGNDVDTPFVGTACEWKSQGPDFTELTCPFGGTIEIIKAHYGRWNTQTCRGNKSGIFGKCDKFVDVIDYTSKECNGKSTCTVVANNKIAGEVKERQDPCRGVQKYTKVEWVCRQD